MIAGLFHSGSGLGNQLHRYVATRVLAADKGMEFSMLRADLFKGKGFLNLDMGEELILTGSSGNFVANLATVIEEPSGRTVLMPGHNFGFWYEKSDCYNPEYNFVEKNTIIDGEFQDERYFGHRIDEIREWLKVEPMDMPDNLCVINFRGGEYMVSNNLFLEKEYWEKAIKLMRDKYPGISFEVHTDDPITARKFFPDFKVWDNEMIKVDFHNHERIAYAFSAIGFNWRAIRYAKHLIISNSSFAILPSLLNQDTQEIIAPKGWSRHNFHDGSWGLMQNYYKRFTYI